MKRKPTWLKLYVFAAVACLVLFLFPPDNQAILIAWVGITYGGIALWLSVNQNQMDHRIHYQYTVVTPPVAEFFDEDRRHWQDFGSAIPTDNIESDPHGAASYHIDEM